MPRVEGPITIEDAQIIFRNFAGKEDKYNREGDRNFCVMLDHELATKMSFDGWNVKMLRSRDEDEPDRPYIQVAVSFKGRPPRIVLITHNVRTGDKTRTDIPEGQLDVLDWVDIVHADLIFRPYNWSVRDATGVKAYLKSLYITIELDVLESKYYDVREVGWDNEPLAITSREEFVEGEVVD